LLKSSTEDEISSIDGNCSSEEEATFRELAAVCLAASLFAFFLFILLSVAIVPFLSFFLFPKTYFSQNRKTTANQINN
jgi:hypothetical protein